MITLIAAVAKNMVIGNGNTIPWHLPEDFKHFSATTKGHTVVMGWNTWESLPPRFRPLPGRRNIVISSQKREVPGGELVHSVQEALDLAANDGEIFVIGGASIYRQTIDIADRLVISHVDMFPEGDTFFPAIDKEVWSERDQKSHSGFVIIDYEKRV